MSILGSSGATPNNKKSAAPEVLTDYPFGSTPIPRRQKVNRETLTESTTDFS